MYCGLWFDPDLGGFADDLVGYDRGRNLGFCYNATNSDLVYGSTPPAVGVDLLKRPGSTPGGLTSTSFAMYTNGAGPQNAMGTYNRLRGLADDGSVIIDPTSGLATTYYYTGDPVQGTGWLDGTAADKRMLLGTGPFTMAPGNVGDYWAAIVIGQGWNRLSSVNIMRALDDDVEGFFEGGILDVPERSGDQAVVHVWPNPGRQFGIGFSLPEGEHVLATVHDLAGRQIGVIADNDYQAGPHVIHWTGHAADGSTAPPGVYWVRLKTSHGVNTTRFVRLE